MNDLANRRYRSTGQMLAFVFEGFGFAVDSKEMKKPNLASLTLGFGE
jgi:hypothetical protein